MPDEGLSREFVVSLVGRVVGEAETCQVQPQRVLVRRKGVEVHYEEDNVVTVVGDLRIDQDLVVARVLEMHIGQLRERRVAAPDLVDPLDERGQRLRRRPVAVLDLVLL